MLTLFNRKELAICQTQERFNDIRDILINNKIRYSYGIKDRNSSNFMGSQRGRTGTFGQNLDVSKTYYIYVHKNDYNEALELIGRR